MTFSSRESKYKSVYGALKTQQEVVFSIYMEKTLNVTKAYIAIKKDGGFYQYKTLKKVDETQNEDVFSIKMSFKEAGLYWYFFSLDTSLGVRNILRGKRGIGKISEQQDEPYQLTVYYKDYVAPKWFGEGITYNIFPDRFYRGGNKQEESKYIHQNWYDTPFFKPNEQNEVLNNDFFGGNFKGIEEKLSYLKELHINTIYLNPIFKAYSNHRYDTGDYLKTDELLGTEKDFESLCKKAEKIGIRIVLDGVFSHTGNDSVYFNAKGNYNNLGAYQSKESEYYKWYSFAIWPEVYSSWWGIKTLPQVNEQEPSYVDFIIENENSVIKKWMKHGASGWRLDVADEVPDDFIKKLNKAAKSVKKDAVIIGEVWEDASNKISYGERRKYFLGYELDSVMNYPLKDSIIAFLKGGRAEEFRENIEILRENYPKEIFNNLMNIIGTHDTARILTVLGARENDFVKPKDQKAEMFLSSEQYESAKRKLFLAAILQFSMPGSPTIYYGDEAGEEGFEDPFNRRGYPWGKEKNEILEFYKRLCKVYSGNNALKKGGIKFIFSKNGVLVFERCYKDDIIITSVNCEDEEVTIPLAYKKAKGLLFGKTYSDINGIEITLDPFSGEIFQIL